MTFLLMQNNMYQILKLYHSLWWRYQFASAEEMIVRL